MRFGLVLILLAACEPTANVESADAAAQFQQVAQAYFSHDGYASMYVIVATGVVKTTADETVTGVIYQNEEGDRVFVADGQGSESFTGYTNNGGGSPVLKVTGKPCEEDDDEDDDDVEVLS